MRDNYLPCSSSTCLNLYRDLLLVLVLAVCDSTVEIDYDINLLRTAMLVTPSFPSISLLCLHLLKLFVIYRHSNSNIAAIKVSPHGRRYIMYAHRVEGRELVKLWGRCQHGKKSFLPFHKFFCHQTSYF